MILYGEHNQISGQHNLTCPEEAAKKGYEYEIEGVEAQPIVVEANGDGVADLFGAHNATRGIWIFNQVRRPQITLREKKN